MKKTIVGQEEEKGGQNNYVWQQGNMGLTFQWKMGGGVAQAILGNRVQLEILNNPQ